MISKIENTNLIPFLMVFFSLIQTVANAQETAIDRYIAQAVESSATLKQEQLLYEKSLYSLKEAKRMFFPTVSIVAEYSFNSGGITIDMPFGDMMNPTYDNLDLINSLNSAQNPGYPNIPKYPSIENTEIPFLFEEEQRTQIQFEMPIYNQALIHNKALQKQVTEVKKINADSYKRELIKEVKSAYLDYKMAVQAVAVGEKALKLSANSLAVSNSLYRNNKITTDDVLKAEAKVKEVENAILEIDKGVILTKAYFNFLLNRKYNEEIELDEAFSIDSFLLEDLDALLETALRNRDELKLIQHSLLIDEISINMEKNDALPLLYLNGSTGYWSTDYSYNNEALFGSVSLSMKWDIFTSGKRNSKIQQAKIDKLISLEKRRDLENNISIQVIDAYNNVKTAQESVELLKMKTENYRASLEIIEKKKTQGMTTQLAYDIAFTDYFESEINLIKEENQYYQKIIELEYSINK